MDEETALRWQFLIVFVVAVLGSIIFVNQEMPWLPAFWASSWMVAFGILAFVRSPELAQTEEFADNFYYLGFLLTLFSLVVVLVRLGRTGAGEGVLGVVLPQFGLALTTTILGLVGRTFLLMFRPDPSDVRERSEQELIRAFDDFTRALLRITAEADAFHERFGTELDISVRKLRSTVDTFGELAEEVVANAAPIPKRLTGVSDALEKTQTDIRSSMRKVLDGLENSYSSVLETADGAMRRVDDVAGNVEAVSQRMEYSSRTFTEAAQALSEGAGSLEGTFRQTSQSLEQVRSDVEALVKESGVLSEKARGNLRQLGEAVEELQTASRETAKVMSDQGEQMRAVAEGWEKDAEGLGDLRGRILDRAEETADALLLVREELAAGVKFLRETLEQRPGRPHEGPDR